MNDLYFACSSCRTYVDAGLAFRTWEEVTAHIQSSKWPPSWWADEDQRRAAQRKFLSLVAQPPAEGSHNDGRDRL
jgi:hypothetical protein